MDEYVEKLEKAIIDLLDGKSDIAHEIRVDTGLPPERCEEIRSLFNYLIDKRKGIEHGCK